MIKQAAIALSLVAVASCRSVDFSSVSPEEFGPRPSRVSLVESANERLQTHLKDPDSKQVRWIDEEPKRAAIWTGAFRGGWRYGWAMRMMLNARNSFGGYTGEKPYYAMLASGKVNVGPIPGDKMLQLED